MDSTVHRSSRVAPWSLDWRGWKRALRGVVHEMGEDHLTLVAGGVAFFGFLSIFPALAALVAGYGLLFDTADVTAQMQQLRGILPSSVLELTETQLQRLADAAPQSLSWGAVVAVVVALWSASKGSRGIIQAINLAYDQQETRGIVRIYLIGLLLTVGTIVFMIIAIALVAVAPVVLAYAGLDLGSSRWLSLARWPLLLGVVLVGIAAVYYIAPDRPAPRWQWLTPGSVFATVSLIAASGLFSLYVSSLGNYNDLYGSLGAVVVFLLWLYLISFVVLLGAELNASVEHQVARATESSGGSTGARTP